MKKIVCIKSDRNIGDIYTMDYCSIDDAFPAMGPPSTALAVKQHRRKKPKQGMTSEPPEAVSLDTDPDRNQYTKKEIPEIESNKEGFSNIVDSTVNFFGKSIDDDFAPYTGPIATDDYLLQPDFKNMFNEKGFGKASGLILKPENTHFKEIDAVFQQTPLIKPVATNIHVTDDNDMKKQLDRLRARLDDLEKTKEITQENTQAEITLFVMSGLAFIFIMDLVGKV